MPAQPKKSVSSLQLSHTLAAIELGLFGVAVALAFSARVSDRRLSRFFLTGADYVLLALRRRTVSWSCYYSSIRAICRLLVHVSSWSKRLFRRRSRFDHLLLPAPLRLLLPLSNLFGCRTGGSRRTRRSCSRRGERTMWLTRPASRRLLFSPGTSTPGLLSRARDTTGRQNPRTVKGLKNKSCTSHTAAALHPS